MTNFMISKYKAAEVGFNKMLSSDQIGITFDCYIRYNGDHTGFFFMVYVWKYGFEFNIYDVRHRDDLDN